MSYPSTPLRRTALLATMAAAVNLGGLVCVGAALAEPAIKDHASVDGERTVNRRIVAVGDIHGAFNGVRTILREAALIDEHDHWAGGDAILVQTGDFLDRGPGAIQAARLLMKLQQQAPASGGDVVVLLGNHEILNLIGDLRDVTEAILEELVDRHSAKRLEVSCNEYVAFQRQLALNKDRRPPKRRELRDKCFAEQRLGQGEYLQEIGPTGEIGRWIRSLPSVVRIGGVVFVHGGISPAMASWSLEQINAEVRSEIHSFDHAREHLLDRGLILPTSSMIEILTAARDLQQADAEVQRFTPPEILQLLEIDEWQMIRDDGPLWFRGYARWDEEEGRELMP
ncbi:MAG: metallophosphoesterase, partial [Thermoanaerobaculia bacterium]